MNLQPIDIVAMLGVIASIVVAVMRRPVDKQDANLKQQQANDIVIDNLAQEVERLNKRVGTLETEKADCAKRIAALEAQLSPRYRKKSDYPH